MAGGMLRKTEKRVRWRGNESLQKGEKMVRLGIRALISRISRRQATPKPPTLLNSDMVYTYSAPFDTGKLKVSDVHSLQLVSSSRPPIPSIPLALLFLVVCLTRERTATRFQEIEMVPQVRSMAAPAAPRSTSEASIGLS